jgi:DNA-binding response OmpR family regulator
MLAPGDQGYPQKNQVIAFREAIAHKSQKLSKRAVKPRKHRKVLIVEDEPGMAEILRLNLQLSDYDVTIAPDGLQALQAFEELKPDLVTIDLNVPKLSGFRLFRLFKQANTTTPVPVVVITASDFEEAEEVVDAGADDFVTKPFDPAELIGKVDFILSRRRELLDSL